MPAVAAAPVDTERRKSLETAQICAIFANPDGQPVGTEVAMRRAHSAAVWLFTAVLLAGPASAQQMFFFPTKGQDQAQQDSDRGACHIWAVNQTGFDPGMAGRTAEAQTRSTAGGAVRGGAMGAAGGAAIGAIAGNAGRGAAIGAVGGGLMGGMRRNSQNQQAQGQAQSSRARQDAQRAEYQRALRACMQGKGYSVG
jgi:hypothetical protein